MSVRLQQLEPRVRRHRRLRARLAGTEGRPRLAVFRSLRHISVQLIDDDKGQTLAAASDAEVTQKTGQSKTQRAGAVGTVLAAKATAKNISAVVFDRGGFRYHGRIKALAEAARAGGLNF